MNKIHIIILYIYIFLQYKAHIWNNQIYRVGGTNTVIQSYKITEYYLTMQCKMWTSYNIKVVGKMSKNLGGGGQYYLTDSTILAFTLTDYANIYKLSHNRGHTGQNLIPITVYKLNELLLHNSTQPSFTHLIK